jgi:hypothetical protein
VPATSTGEHPMMKHPNMMNISQPFPVRFRVLSLDGSEGAKIDFQPLAGETGINFEQTSSKRISGILWQ